MLQIEMIALSSWNISPNGCERKGNTTEHRISFDIPPCCKDDTNDNQRILEGKEIVPRIITSSYMAGNIQMSILMVFYTYIDTFPWSSGLNSKHPSGLNSSIKAIPLQSMWFQIQRFWYYSKRASCCALVRDSWCNGCRLLGSLSHLLIILAVTHTHTIQYWIVDNNE